MTIPSRLRLAVQYSFTVLPSCRAVIFIIEKGNPRPLKARLVLSRGLSICSGQGSIDSLIIYVTNYRQLPLPAIHPAPSGSYSTILSNRRCLATLGNPYFIDDAVEVPIRVPLPPSGQMSNFQGLYRLPAQDSEVRTATGRYRGKTPSTYRYCPVSFLTLSRKEHATKKSVPRTRANISHPVLIDVRAELPCVFRSHLQTVLFV